MARLFIPLLFMSLFSFLVAKEYHHKDRGHGCHQLFGASNGDRKCLSYCLSKNFCTGSCGTSSHSNLTDSVHLGSIKNWCHCFRGENGCHCSHDEDKTSPLEAQRKMPGICVGNGTGHDKHSQKCQKACAKEGYCFGTCFDLKKKGDKSLSTVTCTCYRGPAGCCSSQRLRRGVISSLFGRKSLESEVSTSSSSTPFSSTTSSSSSTVSPSSSTASGQRVESLLGRTIPEMINSTIEWMSNHSLGPFSGHDNRSSTTSSQSSASSSSTPASSTPQSLESEADVQSSGLRTDSSLPPYIPPIKAMLSRNRRHTRPQPNGYPFHGKGCFYHPMTTTSSPSLKPTPARDVLCIRNGLPIYVGSNQDSLCFEVPTPEAEQVKPSHEKEDLFKKPFDLFKPVKI